VPPAKKPRRNPKAASGRTTPSGTRAPSRRYTPPAPKKKARSPMWVPAVTFTALLLGVLVIMLNYLGLLPGDQENRYLILGLLLVTGGFIFSTRLR